MPSFDYPYNYCESADEATIWAIVTEYEMRTARRQAQEDSSLVTATAKATRAMRRLAVAIGGPDV